MHVVLSFNIRKSDARIDHQPSSGLPQQLSVDHLMRGDLYSKVSFRTAVAGCYKDDRLMRTISVQTDQSGP